MSRWYQRSYLHTKCGAGFHHHLAQRWRELPRLVNNNSNTYPADIMLGPRGAASVIRLALGRGVKSQGDSVSGAVEPSASPRWSSSAADFCNFDIDHISNRCLFKLSPTKIRTLVCKDPHSVLECGFEVLKT